MTTKNGGPAFPQITELGEIAATNDGMSLRDYFAAKAMQALISKSPFFDKYGENGVLLQDIEQFRYDIAISAYGYADAMIAAREETTA